MSTEVSFLHIASITIGPVETSLCLGASGTRFFSQRIAIDSGDGSQHGVTLFLPVGQPALAFGDVITYPQVAA
jgi:hypothetical protein